MDESNVKQPPESIIKPQMRTARSDLFWSRIEKRRWFFGLLYGTCLVYATRTSVPLLVPVISKERGWSKTDSGTILSSFFWGYTMTQIAGGSVSDRIGGQKVIFFAAVGWSLTTFFMPEVIRATSGESSVGIIAMFRVLTGAFQGMHFPGMISLTSQRLREGDRASFFSLLTIGSALGTLLTGWLGSFLVEFYSWPLVFRVLGGLSMMWTGLSYYSLLLRLNDAPNRTSVTDSMPWSRLLTKSPFWSCVFAHACQNNCFFVLLSWMPTYFHDTFPEVKGWVVNIVPWLSVLPSTFLAREMTEKMIKRGYSVTTTRKVIETICLLTQAIGLLCLASIESFRGALFCMALIIGGGGFHSNAVVVNPSDLAPKHSGSAFGVMNTVGAIPGFLGVYVAGHILETTRSWPVVFVTNAVINLLGCVIFVVFGSGNAVIE